LNPQFLSERLFSTQLPKPFGYINSLAPTWLLPGVLYSKPPQRKPEETTSRPTWPILGNARPIFANTSPILGNA
jgi:hypothetical protein